MSRSGYDEDYDGDALELYRANVDRSIRGKRGQKLIRDLIAALDAMEEKELIVGELVHDGAVCALGAVGVKRGIEMPTGEIDEGDAPRIAKLFGVAECLAREIFFENDEGAGYWTSNESSSARWQRMRKWAERHLEHTR